MRDKQLAQLIEIVAEELVERGEEVIGRNLLGLAGHFNTSRRDSVTNGASNGASNGHSATTKPETGEVGEQEEERQEEREEVLRVVGTKGPITREIALRRCQELGTFTQSQLAKELGLRPPSVQKFLDVLVREGQLAYMGGKFQCMTLPHLRDWVLHQEHEFSADDASNGTGRPVLDVLLDLERFLTRGVVERVGDSGLWRYVPPDPSQDPKEHPTGLPPERERPSYELAQATGMPVRVSAAEKSTRRARSTPGQRHIIKQRDERYKQQQRARAERAEANKAKAQKDPKWQSRSNKRKAA